MMDCSNLEFFQNFAYAEESDIVFVSETWLKNDICSLEILNSGYTIFRNDRATRGGGVLLVVKSSSFKCVRKVKHDYNLEITLAEIIIITATNMKYYLGHATALQMKIIIGWIVLTTCLVTFAKTTNILFWQETLTFRKSHGIRRIQPEVSLEILSWNFSMIISWFN